MVLERNFLRADTGIFQQNEVPMKKIPLKRIFAAAALVCCLTVTTAYADVTQEDIDNAKNQINNLKKQHQKKNAQENKSSRFRISPYLFQLVHSFMPLSPIFFHFKSSFVRKELPATGPVDYLHKFLIRFYPLNQEFSKYPYKYPFQHNISEPQSDTVLNICFLYI